MKALHLTRPVRALAVLFFLLLVCPVQATVPVVSNIRAERRPGTHVIDIYYNLADADGYGPCTVHASISDNGGQDYNVPVFDVTGAVGAGVTLGSDRHIVWNAGADNNGRFSSLWLVKITADDGTSPPVPSGMVWIPPSPFWMGDSLEEGNANEIPRHQVWVNGFFLDQYMVYRELYMEVQAWSAAHSYLISGGSFKRTNHPVHAISWFDMVKWCNARSEKEGLTPCYYTDDTQSAVYRTGYVNLSNSCVKWDANGYRLPTEAEWEKAARGGLAGSRYPWGDAIGHTNANFSGDPLYNTGSSPYTSPVGSFPPNGYDLSDMNGNLWQWCWDWFGDNFYTAVGATVDNPQGPLTGTGRVLRGGNWSSDAYAARCSFRINDSPSLGNYYGFRCARGQ